MSYTRVLMAVALVAGSFAFTANAQAQVFGYPAGNQACGGNCQSGGRHGHFQQFRAKVDHWSMINERVRQRNDAWPKPFACLDRQAYSNVWSSMLSVGQEQRCLLSDAAFDAKTNELNQLGIAQVADIMRTMPNSGRTVFVQQAPEEVTNQQRMEQVKTTIDRYYAHHGPARIILSNRLAHLASANESDLILRGRADNLPAPTIQAAAGGSVAQEVGQ